MEADTPAAAEKTSTSVSTVAAESGVQTPASLDPAVDAKGTRVTVGEANEKADQTQNALSDDDVDNPRNWSPLRRWLIIIFTSLMVSVNVLGPSMIIPAAPQVLETFHITDTTYRTLLVTIWELGECLSSFVAGPLSEIYGRLWVYHCGNFLGLIAIIASALSVDISMLIVFRCLSGFFLVAPSIQPAIVGDVTRPESRGSAMAISLSIRLLAPFVAPISGAYINQALGWRWVIWILAILVGTLFVLSVLVVRETYAVKILQTRVSRAKSDPEATIPGPGSHSRPVGTILSGLSRPVRLLLTSPILVLISIYNGLGGGILYLLLTTLTEVMETEYGFSRGSVGLTYIAPSTGLTLGLLVFGLTSDRYIKYQKKRNNGELEPKHRLFHVLFGSCVLPSGLLIYGWTLYHRAYFIIPLIGVGIGTFGYLLISLPITNYLVDAFGVHSASAVAANFIVLSVFSTAFPLIGPTMFKTLGYGWGNTLLALLSTGFIPFLFYLIRFRR